MKHLKAYNILRNVPELHQKWIRDEIMDLLSNLVDNYSVRISNTGSNNGYVSIYSKTYGKNISLSDIRGDVLRMIEFLKDRYRFDITYAYGSSSVLRKTSFEEFSLGSIRPTAGC